MRIAIIGYGKMGRVIEKLALERGHTIDHKLNFGDSIEQLTNTNTDIAIEFTGPESAHSNISYCINNGIPIVSGSTGWLDQYDEICNLCNEKKGAFFYASNYSVGVNIFFRLNELLAKMMNPQSDYNVSMEEIHHTEKLDSPSGTGITLADGIINQTDHLNSWVNEASNDSDALEIISKRIDKVPGTHTITYDSTVDSIEIKHTAHSRDGFALGSILAAEWLKEKQGVFGMNDMIKL